VFIRLSNSWELVKASARVLKADKELLIFPILSTIGVILVSIAFLIPMFLGGIFDALISDNVSVFGVLIGFFYYVTIYTVIFFANTALVGAALIRLRGGDPTVSDGIRIASKQFFNILGYALIAATVGVILNAIRERSKWLGRIVISIIGLAWNVGTFLVVPILAAEEIGPIDAIKKSVDYLKRTWGEQLAGNFGIGTIMGLITFAVIALGGGGLAFAATLGLSAAMLIPLGALLVLIIVFLSLISSTLTGIFTAALYEFAVTGEVANYFEPTIVKNAFLLKDG
jgi:hypothetical protein